MPFIINNLNPLPMNKNEVITALNHLDKAGTAKNLAMFFLQISTDEELRSNMVDEPTMFAMLIHILEYSEGELDEVSKNQLIDLMAEKAQEEYPLQISKFFVEASAQSRIRGQINPQLAHQLYELLQLLDMAHTLKEN